MAKRKEDDSSGPYSYRLTKWACLESTLNDYGISLKNIKPKVGEHIVDDFMDLMIVQGYVDKKDN